jgi:hypothetical protein
LSVFKPFIWLFLPKTRPYYPFFHLSPQKAGGVSVQTLYSLFVGCLVESLFYSFPMEAVKFRRIQPLEGF